MRPAPLRSFALAALAALPLAATLDATPATAAVPAAVSPDACATLQADAEEGRFACVADAAGGRWAVRLDAPAPGARDLTLSALHEDARGVRTPFTARVGDAASWWYTIAPLTSAAHVDGGGALSVALTRVGVREYPLGQFAFEAWRP